ncbi:MAG: class I adenylate-forming enzyme family protein [candidate division Zixibacteria bacterium]|nr:class I adenylate-forming enzyme family protein [candidate division Zixibacteria bacterium]
MMSNARSPILWDYFSEKSKCFADRIAVTASGRDITFGRLFSEAGNLADKLADMGLERGDIVGHTMKNGAEFVVVFLALCKLSAATALVPEKYQQSEMDFIRRHLRPKCFIGNESLYDSLSRKIPMAQSLTIPLPDSDGLRVVFPAPVDGGIEPSVPLHTFPQPITLIKFTSGSTGLPKAVALSPRNILAETENIVQTLNISIEDRLLAALPLSHSYGFDLGVLMMLGSGARLIVHENFIPRKVLREIEQQRVSVFLGVPSMYKLLLETRCEKAPDFSGVRYLLSCTAPLGTHTIREFHSRFGAWICQHYGSSETGAAANHINGEIDRHPDAVGAAMKKVRIRVVDPEDRPVPPGTDGEVVVAGDNVAQGYLMGRPEHRQPLRDNSYWTGDVGCLDSEGFLYIKGRLDQMINVGGQKVSPDEVAAVLESHPAVREAAAVGVKDDDGDEVIVAVAAVREPADEDDILAFCRGRLAAYKVPRRVVFMPELPKGPSGKICISPQDLPR